MGVRILVVLVLVLELVISMGLVALVSDVPASIDESGAGASAWVVFDFLIAVVMVLSFSFKEADCFSSFFVRSSSFGRIVLLLLLLVVVLLPLPSNTPPFLIADSDERLISTTGNPNRPVPVVASVGHVFNSVKSDNDHPRTNVDLEACDPFSF